ncbi:hypothetical protein LCGC14_0484100, partial [marine sediment metagenome]
SSLFLGCAKSMYSFLDSAGNPVVVEQSFFGRGSLAVKVDEQGVPHVVICQDGTSDWITGRLLAAFGNLAAKMMAPVPILGEMVKVQSPSDIQACSALYDKVVN